MNLRTKILLVLALWITTGYVHAQSDNCATATPLTLVNGQLCVNGTTQNATSNNTMYGSCNPNPVNEVWYTYVAAGGQNDYTITSNGMTNAEIVIDITGCVDTLFSTCDVTTGTSTLSTSWGITPGTQVLIMIASNGGVDGDFQFCVDSYDPPPGGGNACTGAIPLCDKTQTYNFPDMSVLSSSGISSTCFPGAGNQDLWYQFTVVQSGTLEWEATPSGVDIELDWSLWDITSGCPGAEVACNYNFTAGLFSPSISAPVGMIGTTSCVACPTGGNMQAVCGEYCDPITVTAGNTYAILIDNYTTALPTGLDFVFGSGMTAEIAPNADFTINPSGITCGSNITINIADLSLGIPDWTFGNGNTFTGNNPPAQTYTVPGVYAITASISGSCPSIHTEYVEIYGPLTATTTATNENCSACDGTASVTAAGGDGVFSYQWSNLATTPNISGLCTGTYSVTVSNATCGTQVIETVVVGSGGLFPFTVTNTNTACPGDSTGTATFTALSGNAPYTYLWSNGNTSSTAVGLSAGVYSVTVADVFGCDTNTTVTINDPSPVLIDASNVVITNASCTGADGSIIGITASGGTGALTYSWVDGSSTVVGTAADLTLVGTGSYTLLVTDANNCSATSGPYFVVATTATAVTMTGGATNCYQSCDASGSASAGGGTPPYFYSWSTNPAQTSNIATGLCQGTYYVTVTDASCSASGIELAANGDFSAGNSGFTSSYYFCNSGGCLGPEGGFGVGTSGAFYNGGFTGVDNTTGSGNFMVVNGSVTAGAQIWCQTITVNPNTNYQFSTWLSSMNTSNVAVLQFSVNNTPFGTTFNAPGSTGTWIQFFETWNSGTNTSATICIINQNTNSSGNDFGLDDISFQECVNSCPTIDSLVITEPIEISVVPMKSDALCNASCDGTASVIVSGGTFPYTYLWSSSGTSSTETALCAGTYSVTITDLNGCDTIIAIPIMEPTFLGSVGSTVAEKCENGDGEATVSPFGGSPPYTFLWDDPLQQTTDTATGLVTQTYNVLITDSLGCTFTLPLSVSEILGPDIDLLQGTDLLCAGDADATASVFVSGGSQPFTYLWDDPAAQTNSAATNLSAGTYSVTVTDLFGCDSSQTITIVDPPLLSVSVSGTSTLCFGETPGNLNAAASGGQGPYTYSWDDPNTSTTAAVVLLTPTSGT
ncbi:MAG: SprB repeat-containing protein, partial [Flavobacteriales bacterium]|nr:SprB repeat-containing protein [Flavobacteriales bacterium]